MCYAGDNEMSPCYELLTSPMNSWVVSFFPFSGAKARSDLGLI